MTDTNTTAAATTTANRIPKLVTTSDSWTTDRFVVFEDEPLQSLIPDEWIEDSYFHACTEYEFNHQFDDEAPAPPTREEIAANMFEQFTSDNSTVDDFWPELMILRTDRGEYYRYTNDGDVIWIEADDLPIQTLRVEYDRDGEAVYAYIEDAGGNIIDDIKTMPDLIAARDRFTHFVESGRWDGETSGSIQGYNSCTTGGVYEVFGNVAGITWNTEAGGWSL